MSWQFKNVHVILFQLKTLPEHVIVETTDYKCLQSQFSVLYNESMQMKTQLEESRALLQTSKNAHLRQIEQMEVRTWVDWTDGGKNLGRLNRWM